MLPAFAEDGTTPPPVVAWTTSAEESLLRRETRARVRAAIAGLPESYRTVLLLRDIEERSTREAANLLGITENAMKLRLHRARQALATKLGLRSRRRQRTTAGSYRPGLLTRTELRCLGDADAEGAWPSPVRARTSVFGRFTRTSMARGPAGPSLAAR